MHSCHCVLSACVFGPQVAGSLKARPEEVPQRVASLQAELKASEKLVAELRSQMAIVKSEVGGGGGGGGGDSGLAGWAAARHVVQW